MKKPNVLEEAVKLVYGDRQAAYDHPARDFEHTAALWEAWLHRRGVVNGKAGIDAEDVAMMMVLLKISREAHKHKRDNLVDAAGYLLCLSRVLGEDA